jgi:hypothetical protein
MLHCLEAGILYRADLGSTSRKSLETSKLIFSPLSVIEPYLNVTDSPAISPTTPTADAGFAASAQRRMSNRKSTNLHFRNHGQEPLRPIIERLPSLDPQMHVKKPCRQSILIRSDHYLVSERLEHLHRHTQHHTLHRDLCRP